MTKLSFYIVPSNVNMLEMMIFGDVNKLDLTKMDLNPLLGQGRRRREIVDNIMII